MSLNTPEFKALLGDTLALTTQEDDEALDALVIELRRDVGNRVRDTKRESVSVEAWVAARSLMKGLPDLTSDSDESRNSRIRCLQILLLEMLATFEEEEAA